MTMKVCACDGEGEGPDFRNHGPYSCDNDYHSDDPGCCGVNFLAPWSSLETSVYCRKVKGHKGIHSGHNDCGASLEGAWFCGRDSGHDSGIHDTMCLIVNGREATTLLPDLTYELAVSLASLDVSRRPTVVCRLRSIGQEITPGFSVPVCNGLVVNVAYTDAA